MGGVHAAGDVRGCDSARVRGLEEGVVRSGDRGSASSGRHDVENPLVSDERGGCASHC
jgi:hypothetical protein